jgi:TetR/AcrR family transcriptional regulator, lmrAB and yxaGH operons repressor
MPAALIPKEEVLNRLTAVFRERGYEGASLSELSRATGLVKASLYHYFPGGKAEMAEAVLARANQWLGETALSPLSGPGSPRDRLEAMVDALRSFYAGGSEACLLGLLSQGEARDRFQAHVRTAMRQWADAVSSVLKEAGLSADVAQARGEDAVIRIQGALVVARGLDDLTPFARTLDNLPAQLLAPEGHLSNATQSGG